MQHFTWVDAAAVAIAIGLSVYMLRPSIRDAELWRATVTPLASIIGSGFLIVAPLLAAVVGSDAPLVMIGIVLMSFWTGAAIRYNIMHDGKLITDRQVTFAAPLERASDLALAFAYVISIAFYIRLMAGFVLTGIGLFDEFNADALAAAVLLFIGVYGAARGLKALERLEEYSVTIKLAIIGSLLAGLAWHGFHNGYTVTGVGTRVDGLWERLRLIGGMLLIVQGFETSKYLGAAYSPAVRVRSMRNAQVLAGLIYAVFVGLALPLTIALANLMPNETAIVGIAREITPILPLMLIVAAVMSQFSAAIADTIGAGGVVSTESRGRFTSRRSYPFIVAISIVLIWVTNIFEIVALASRAFAIYYFLQALLALRLSAEHRSGHRRVLSIAGHAALALVMLAIVIFARAAEG